MRTKSFLISLFCCSGFVHAQQYQLNILPTLGGSQGSANAISENGIVVGTSDTASTETAPWGQTHSFVYQNGVLTDITSAAFPTNYAMGVNASGHVVGSGYGPIVGSSAYYYNGSSMLPVSPLPYPIGRTPYNDAVDINDSGVIVGTSLSSGGYQQAYRALQGGTPQPLGKLGGVNGQGIQAHSSYGSAINNAGTIVGTSEIGQGPEATRAFVWEQASGMRDLGTFRGIGSTAIDISENGKVLGTVRHDNPGGPMPMLTAGGSATVRGLESASSPTRLPGIDVSHWQGTINWDRVFAGGSEYAIIKATESTGFVDPKFKTNVEQATRAGVAVGAYHFARPGTGVGDAAAEANFFVDTILPQVQSGNMHIRPVLDLEVNDSNMSWQALSDWAGTFMQTVQDRFATELPDLGQPVRPILYANSNYAQNLSDTLTNNDLWVAHYRHDPTLEPNAGKWGSDWLMWQYSDNESVSGISGGVDANVLNENRSILDLLLPFTSTPSRPDTFVHDTQTGLTTYLGQGGNLEATAINSAGDVVGHRYDPETGEQQAVLVRKGQVIPLQSLVGSTDLQLAGATDINDAGQIVGYGYRQNGEDFEQRAFVLSASPGPAQVVVVPAPDFPPSQLTDVVKPSSSQLRVLGDGQLQTDRPTFVLTHGWRSAVEGEWPVELASEIGERFGNVNLVAWDWEGDADTGVLFTLAGSRTPAQGKALGDALLATLGTDYDKKLHFIGHSFGTFVNRFAIEQLHREGFDASNNQIQTTLLDPADLGMTGNVSWAGPIPDRAAFIDNYISATASWHDEAVNVYIRDGLPFALPPGLSALLGAAEYHGQPVAWYSDSVTQDATDNAGFEWSIINPGRSMPPVAGDAYIQTLSPFDSSMELSESSEFGVKSAIALRNGLYGVEAALVPATGTLTIIQAVGQVTAEYVGDQLRVVLFENSPAYAYIPLDVPENANFLTLDFGFDGLDENDLFTLGVGQSLMFALEGDAVAEGVMFNTGMLDISAWQGDSIVLFVGLNSDGLPGGSITLERFEFVTFTGGTSIPEPSFVGGLLLVSVVLRRPNRAARSVRAQDQA